MKKLIAVSLISLLTLGSAQTAMAEVIDLCKGNLVISDSGDYEVTSTGETSNVIIVNNGINAYIVLKGVTIKTTDKNGISIGQNADVVLELDGTNSIEVDDGAFAGINAANGTLTIKDENNINGSLEVATSYNSDGAGIGSDGEQNFSGTIVIEGGKIIAESGYGASIGSGFDSDMTGSITISGGNITANSEYGTGIGSGYNNFLTDSIMSGSIIISGGTVNAASKNSSAGIGSGYESDMTGSVTISDGNVYAISSKEGAGIGSGNEGDMSGSVTISGGIVNAESKENGAGIGSGFNGDMSGFVTISGGNVNAESDERGAAIGAGDCGSITNTGKITIGGKAYVNAESTWGLGIGSGDYGNMDGSIIIKDNSSVNIIMSDKENLIGIGTCHNSNYYGDEDYFFNGSINILGNSKVNMNYVGTTGTPGIGIEGGSATGTITLSQGASINEISGAAIETLKGMGILNGNTTSVDHTYAPEESNPVDPGPDDPGPDDPGPVDPGPDDPELDVPKGESYSLTRLNIKQRIDKAQTGDTVSVSESQLSKGKLPSYVLEALALKEDVTLAIFCEEFAILIPSDEVAEDAGSKQFYTIDELVKIYE